MTEIMGNELLQGERVYLDAVTREDIPRFVAWYADMEFQRFLRPGIVFPFTQEDEKEWYENQRKDKDQFNFSIRRKDGDVHIGSCGLMNLHWQARHATAGIAVGEKSVWGKGYGTDAMRVLLRYGFMELNLNRIGLETSSYNVRAIKSYEKVGFQHEARQRQTTFRDGVYHDTILMSILRREWEAQQP